MHQIFFLSKTHIYYYVGARWSTPPKHQGLIGFNFGTCTSINWILETKPPTRYLPISWSVIITSAGARKFRKLGRWFAINVYNCYLELDKLTYLIECRGSGSGCAGWAIAHPLFSQMEAFRGKKNFENWSKIDRDGDKNVNCTPTF